jgi:hypothetical protein
MPISWVRRREPHVETTSEKGLGATMQLLQTAKDHIMEKREDLMSMELMMQGHFFGMMAHLTSQVRQSNGYS